MTTLDEILAAAQLLDPSERAQLIARLWDDSVPEDWVPPSPEWISEANRRSDAFDSGEATASTWKDVRGRARKKARLDD